MKRILLRSIAVVLAAVIVYSGYRLWDIQHNYAQEKAVYSQLLQYKPAPGTPSPGPALGSDPGSVPGSDSAAAGPAPVVNQNIVDLQAKYPGVAGWLTVPNTNIDYPFAQSADNDYYLRRDLDGKSLTAGTLFMDYRNHKDFSDFNTIVYGHHMKNGSMFGTLNFFNTRSFFDNNATGTIYLADKTYKIKFFAFIVIRPDDAEIYDPAVSGDADKAAFLTYVKSAARYYRDVGVTLNDRLVTLSTCNYEFNNARMVLIGTLTEN